MSQACEFPGRPGLPTAVTGPQCLGAGPPGVRHRAGCPTGNNSYVRVVCFCTRQDALLVVRPPTRCVLPAGGLGNLLTEV